MRKNIVHFITGLSVGGAEMMLLKLLQTEKDTHNFLVISLTDYGLIGEKINSLGINVVSLNLKFSLVSFRKIFSTVRLIKSFNPHVFHSWMYHANIFSYFLSPLFRTVQNIWGIRQTLYRLNREKKLTRLVIFLNKHFSSKVDLIIYNSKKSLEQHFDYGFSESNSLIIPNGFDVNYFSSSRIEDGKRIAMREALRINKEALVFGMIARFHPMKGHHILISSALEVLREYPDVIYLFAGDGIKHSELVSLIPENFRNSFIFLERRDDVPEILSIIDISVNASIWGEAFSNSIGEAMLMQLPNIVTDTGDSAYIIGDSGIIVEANNIQKMTVAILQMIDMTKDERKDLGVKARERVIKHFSIEKVSKEFIAHY